MQTMCANNAKMLEWWRKSKVRTQSSKMRAEGTKMPVRRNAENAKKRAKERGAQKHAIPHIRNGIRRAQKKGSVFKIVQKR